MRFPTVQEQLDTIVGNVVEIISVDELEKKLQHSLQSGKPLKVKLGADPSRPDLHLGHSVVLRKLREFQDLGHEAILIIGDFTAMIGDPSGKSKTRPQLSAEEARENGKSYFEQASKILDAGKTTICYNADWLGKMGFSDVIRLSSHYTVARMLERDDFERRYRSNEPISIHEFLYPLAQGMDSVHLKNDVELGGTDQKFNLLVGRDLQREYGIAPQVCITMELLVGTDGKEKMSKSLGNAICFNDTPNDMYGKALSIPDSLIETWHRLLVSENAATLAGVREVVGNDPRAAKRDLARAIVAQYYSDEAARVAEEHFDRIFVQKKAPENIELFEFDMESMPIVDMLVTLCAAPSKSEARRMIQQNAVTVDEEKITNVNAAIELVEEPKIVKAGKRKFYKVAAKKTF
ncbi:MAG: tyrosine--tRNA ligase [Chlorobium sp.]|jgi:tyrosyl-tRNA synthetase|uniref:tyrosine--tRNA ligase n=1 Tax=Chlorobium sp. TaxID=1095 RepID=UPI0025C169C4|nr:tyrosine--tRNA ligase [Chlorobium sp.]MCF8216127.1 tyrosine--tRNA ligase [Chlorobium sp.]MCF8271088.1 tyrosine--tRNA ligase [Chlorobium sp.]MCF8287402.1 tyrosine--tRNA ligase [Chlorobium sp.]MCF8291001.1 tyrosine--tRNA ligase [Chlorobium sp.]MCF8385096.1 tyrosine--tRNA ligase [Chlorobium sp.]